MRDFNVGKVHEVLKAAGKLDDSPDLEKFAAIAGVNKELGEAISYLALEFDKHLRICECRFVGNAERLLALYNVYRNISATLKDHECEALSETIEELADSVIHDATIILHQIVMQE